MLIRFDPAETLLTPAVDPPAAGAAGPQHHRPVADLPTPRRGASRVPRGGDWDQAPPVGRVAESTGEVVGGPVRVHVVRVVFFIEMRIKACRADET